MSGRTGVALTNREKAEIVAWLREGIPAKVIMERKGISRDTVSKIASQSGLPLGEPRKFERVSGRK